MAKDSKSVRRDAFIKHVRPDPKSIEDLVLLQGYIGDSDMPDHIRVYTDPTLEEFIDLPENEVLYAQPVDTTEDPLGGSRLWVKKTMVFTTGDPRHANRVKSSFLEGDLMRAYAQSGYAEKAFDQPGPIGDRPTVLPTCASLGNTACITNNSPCPSVGICPISINQPLCTVVRPTIVRPTCFRTCFQPTCYRTCNTPTCVITCNRPTCFRTCIKSCGFICTIQTFQSKYCDILIPHTIQDNPSMQCFGEGYTGGFDPYMTNY